eukprot:jgi/Astpho2/3550/Aster-x1155
MALAPADEQMAPAAAEVQVVGSQTLEAQSNFDIPLFDRESEQELLLKRLMARPDNIMLILGPQSSGKTRLLRELLLGLS